MMGQCHLRKEQQMTIGKKRNNANWTTLSKMTNSQKRCMIYWWYATNIYSICGKKNRMKLPDCLVNAVRKAYPEPDGNYEGFHFSNE